MFGFFKKVKSWFVDDAEAIQPPVAPYKIEAPVQAQVVEKVAPVKLRQPGTPKQGQKKPAQGKKPQGGQKPATQKKPAQPKPQGGQKPSGNKPRGRRPKAKPAAPQQ
jgi:hypothetical protein